MKKEELYNYVFKSNVFKRWHWFSYHFDQYRYHLEHPLAEAIIQTCIECEEYIPGFAEGMIDVLASISGKEKYEPHYEQLLQRLAELHVIKQVLTFDWLSQVSFRWEPTPTKGGKKNPEIIVDTHDHKIGIEVKAPSLLNHLRERFTNPTQVPARVFSKELIKKLPGADIGVTTPRDNPIKDFLISAEGKFFPFKQENKNFFSVLVIVWDDYLYEPISSLLHPNCGLLTPNSFAQDGEGQVRRFPSVDGIVLIPHLHQLIRATRDEPLIPPCFDPLDYGKNHDFPIKVFISNPYAMDVPQVVLECFQAYPPSVYMGSEYIPQDLIFWLS
ncbi:MAG: hypothetical protein EWV82_00095 [Microcystis aeruginosa Ma_AC_P_19900807_S299]|nr:MAG: hypothetical protein EWV82_00095 [Microcystis aeruginosa Ma_AC_P_19900807_S299]